MCGRAVSHCLRRTGLAVTPRPDEEEEEEKDHKGSGDVQWDHKFGQIGGEYSSGLTEEYRLHLCTNEGRTALSSSCSCPPFLPSVLGTHGSWRGDLDSE